MAARDETYRNQRTLDLVFAVSCVALVASMIWMFAVDHNREWKDIQRKSRDVEVRLLLAEAEKELEKNKESIDRLKPDISKGLKERFGVDVPANLKVEEFLPRAKAALGSAKNDAIRKIESELAAPKVELYRLSIAINEQRAVRDSLISARDIQFNQGVPNDVIAQLEAGVAAKAKEVQAMEKRHDELKQKVLSEEAKITAEREPVQKLLTELDDLTRVYDRLLRTAEQRRVTFGTRVRSWPVLDAFAPPYKIVQHTPEGLTIDYNFKQVQRVDRCASCHVFIDRQEFSKDNLRELAALKKDPLKLDEREIAVYAHHPRLDLFLGSNSPHPIEKFGCTTCHAGQGGSTSFDFAYHFPDVGPSDGEARKAFADLKRRYADANPPKTDSQLWNEVWRDRAKLWTDKYKRWEKDNNFHADLHPNFVWDFPMTGKRFTESSCLKCHHQVADLVRTDGREEAPKLLQGYRLIRDNGCFGCHEISGYKQKRQIGPDMRLEPHPPLDELTAVERSKIDPNDPPGNLRKVGPGLFQVATKLDEDFMNRWVRSPRSFRHDTKMPHFFGRANNTPGQLADNLAGPSQLAGDQELFPDAEIKAMTFYLLHESQRHLKDLAASPSVAWVERIRGLREQLLNAPPGQERFSAEFPRTATPDQIARRLLEKPELQALLTKDQIMLAAGRLGDLERMQRQHQQLAALPYGHGKENAAYPPEGVAAGNATEGKRLFELRGCVACHVHDGASKIYDAEERQINNSAFGPNLTHLKEKLKGKGERWLYNWLSDPSAYHPRTLMPTPKFLGDAKQQAKERVDVIAFLLQDSKPGVDFLSGSKPWDEVKVGTGDPAKDKEALAKLARTHLEKAIPRTLVDDALKADLKDEFFLNSLRADADERVLDAKNTSMSADDRLQWYVGRKSITKYGCYGCHDVPGFEQAKPIGTPLNDWGKKPSDRLAFDNINDFLKALYNTPHLHGNHGHPKLDAKKPTYDAYYLDAIEHGRREGFLFQKLREPRSYDYGKLKDRPWDDRLKMPQFKFAHPKPTRKEAQALAVPAESRDDEQNALVKAFLDRAAQEEEQAAEAVMTFILGLVAEPTALQFVSRPKDDRLHEVRGIKILEKHNCISCHTTKAGTYEFPLNSVIDEKQTGESILNYLTSDSQKRALLQEVEFPSHSAWRTARPYPEGKVVARGLPVYPEFLAHSQEGGYQKYAVTLYEALRIMDSSGNTHYWRPGMDNLELYKHPAWASSPPVGGQYAEVMARRLKASDPSVALHEKKLLQQLPPPLIREGQKVQARWLMSFLREPHEIRPQVAQHLRMPTFNLTDEEIQALVDYFVAVDRLENAALGTEYTVPDFPSRDPRVQQEQRQALRSMVAPITGRTADPEADYYEYGWRFITNKSNCLSCHNVGKLQSEGKAEEKGPNLDSAPQRLRPEYIVHWVSRPSRILPYTMMKDHPEFLADRPALPPDKLAAFYREGNKLAEAGKWYFPLDRGLVYSYIVENALTPQQRTRAVRDALMTWGYLAQPPPSAQKVGPPEPVKRH